MGSWERERRHQGPDHEEEPLVRRGPSPGKRSLTHRFVAVSDGMAPDAAVASRVEAATGGDLSGVRVHTDGESQSEASALRARAFTVGRDIHFASGQYQPGTPAGDALLAHELVHTLQQKDSLEPAAQLKSADVSREGEAAEREADRIAGAALSGAPVRTAPVERAAAISLAPETLSGNPAEKKDSTGASATSHRSVGVNDSASAPPVGVPGVEARTTNVKPKATELAPFHVAGAICPVDSVIFEEDTSGATPPPAGFTQVTGFTGTTAEPMITQEASKGIYIGGAPSMADIQQGSGIGDCYFLALVASIVSRDPGKIPSIMVPDGNGGATVTLWRARPHIPSIWERVFGGAPPRDWIQVAVTVNDQLAVNISDNRVHGAALRCAPSPIAQDWWSKVVSPNLEIHRKDTFEVARWAPLLEKAYARFAQNHDNYGGARPDPTTGASGYDAINGGWSNDAMCVFYGPVCDDPNRQVQWQGTSWTPGGNVVTANAAVMDQLILLQGRGEAAGGGERDAPLVQATSSVDPLITRLQAAIPVAQADPDYAKVDATRQALVTAVATSVATWAALPPDPALPAPQPKATAQTAVGAACVNAVRPGIDESTSEQEVLKGMRSWAGSPITFGQGDATITAGTANETNLKNLNQWLTFYQSPQVQVSLEGHSSAEGTEADNQTLSQKRVDATDTLVSAGGVAPHTVVKNAAGERGANRDPAWRRVDLTVTPTGHKTNSLLDGARSRSIREMTDLMVDLRNIGTDHSMGQRNIYGDHVYTVIAVNIVTTSNQNVPLNAMPAGAARAALYHLVDPNVSTVRLRNPHHGNEPDPLASNRPRRPGDGNPSDASADGVFTMSLSEFFLHFTSVQSGVMPKT